MYPHHYPLVLIDLRFTSKNMILVWIGSERSKFWQRKVSSFLGEMDTIVWALCESLWLMRGSQITVLTDNRSLRFRETKIQLTKNLGERVGCRFLGFSGC